MLYPLSYEGGTLQVTRRSWAAPWPGTADCLFPWPIRWSSWPTVCGRRSRWSAGARASIRWCVRPSMPTPRPTARYRSPRSSADRRARWPRRCSTPPTSAAWPPRSRSPGPASSTSRSIRRGSPTSPRPSRPTTDWAWQQAAEPERVVVDYSAPECGQGDAHRPSPHHRHRRCAGPRARVPRPRRGPREPHRRLGPSVRHAHRAPRRRRRRVAPSGSASAIWTRFYKEATTKFADDDEFRDRARQRVVLLQNGDVETLRAVADVDRPERDPLGRGVRQARRAADRRRPGGGEPLRGVDARGRRAARQGRPARGVRRRARSCSRPGSPTGRASRCR